MPGLHSGDPHLPPPLHPIIPYPSFCAGLEWFAASAAVPASCERPGVGIVSCFFVCVVLFPFKFLPWYPISIVGMTLVVASLKTDRRRPLEYTLQYVLYGFLIVT